MEIPKFRAWLIKEKKMVDVAVIDFDTKRIGYNESKFNFYWVSFDDVELMQSTRSSDKNNIEIHDSDIVRIELNGFQPIVGFITYCNGEFKVQPKRGASYSLSIWNKEHLEVLGNIYKNYELLEGTK